MTLIFRTERLVLRDWTTGDAPAAFGIYGREEVIRWLGAPPRRPVESLAAMRERMPRLIARNAERPGYGQWPVQRADDGVVVGAVLLLPLQAAAPDPAAGPDPAAAPDVEIGWHFNPDHWGHGYATEAARGLIDMAFGERGLDRVIAVVDPGNVRSLAVCGRLGMTHHGLTDQYYGITLELYSLDRPAG